MRSLTHLEEYRITHPFLGRGDERNGAFKIKLTGSRLDFAVIVSDGSGWEHVSISTNCRCPKWDEMQQIKELFFEDEEIVIQFHPPKSQYVNNHPFCLHLWRPIDQVIPLPDRRMVGIK